MDKNELSKLKAAALVEIRKSEIAAAKAMGYINQCRVAEGLKPIFVK